MTRPAHILAAAALALGLSGDAEAEDVDTSPPLELHEKQRAFIEDDSFIVCVLGGRQGGKSFVMAAKGCRKIVEKPKAYVLILGLTSEGCRDSVWPEIKLWAEELGIDEYVRDHEMRVGPLPNGSYLKCKGTDDRRAIENRRGAKPDLVMIDEMGSQDPAWIQYFVTSVIGPSMIKKRGQIVLGGTPGLVLTGYWYDLTNEHRDPNGAPVYEWTAWDNPGLGTPEEVEEFVQTWLDAAGLNRESVAYLREWRAKWVDDLDSLVYPLDCEEGRGRNWAASLPQENSKGYVLDPTRWRFCIAADVGMVDATALGVVAGHPDVANEYVVWTEKHYEMIPAALAQRFREVAANDGGIVPQALEPALKRARRVLDTGGMGKVHAVEFARVFGTYVKPAEKTEKESAIELNRGRIKAGYIKVLEGERNDAFRRECTIIGWDPKALAKGRRLPKEGAEDHAFDCVTYGLRELRHYVKQEPDPDTRSVPERTADELMAKREKRYKRKRRGVVVR